ncbi:amidohydrolase family protein [Anaerobacillus alkalilacustris]|uniref:amidohydrolase family protein n=1 Tax=Anaerobacillus alkalilacustris TaxID=393763 RepID=UPI000A03D6BA|nr:amidohydrolase family protein [Anaerobacillus alkalilacustris]
MANLLIKNIEIVTMNEKNEIFVGDIIVEDDLINQIGKNLPISHADKVIDGKGRTIIPGFVQTHIHLCQTLFRGRADDLELLDWLKKKIWPLEAAHDEESIYYSALLGIGELIQSGTTTIVDMETVHHTDFAFQAIAASGMRALSGKVMMDKGNEAPKILQENTIASIQKSVDLLEKWNMYDQGRIKYAFSPRFVVSCSEELLKEVSRLSILYHVYVHTHASENRGEIEIVEYETGMRNVTYLDHQLRTGSRGIWNDVDGQSKCVITYQELAKINHFECSREFHFPTTPDPIVGAHYLYTYTAVICEVEVNLLTGMVDVLQIDHVVADGPVVNPMGYLGQIEGGAIMALGFTLHEDAVMDVAQYMTKNLDTYLIPMIFDVPVNQSVEAIEKLLPDDQYGPLIQ